MAILWISYILRNDDDPMKCLRTFSSKFQISFQPYQVAEISCWGPLNAHLAVNDWTTITWIKRNYYCCRRLDSTNHMQFANGNAHSNELCLGELYLLNVTRWNRIFSLKSFQLIKIAELENTQRKCLAIAVFSKWIFSQMHKKSNFIRMVQQFIIRIL